jgi:predicted DNA-binding ribbon-helix-helix protein
VHDLILDLARTAMLEENNHVRTDESIINLPLKLKLPVYTKLREMAKGSHCSLEKMVIELVEKEHRARKFGVSLAQQGIQKLPK